MSSSEQAPEPTMDEILASIRKIISDDETGDDAQPEVAAAEPAAPAGDGLADELANALADAQGADGQAAAEPPDDILDLTQVVTEQPEADASPEPASPEPAPLEPVSQEPAPLEVAPQEAAPQEAAMPVTEDVQPDAAPAEPEAEMTAAAPVAPDVLAEIEASTASEASEASEAPESSAGASDITALLAEAGVQEMNDDAEAAPQEALAPAGDDLTTAIAQDDTAVPDPVLVEETSISDALSALDQPAADAAPDTEPQSQDDASFDADLVMSPEPAPVTDEPSEAIAPEVSEAAPEAEAVFEIESDAGLDVQIPELSAEEPPAQTQIEDALPEPEALVIDEPVEAAAALAGALEEPVLIEEEPAGSEAIVESEAVDEVEAADDIVEAAASLDADAEEPAADESVAEEPAAEASSGDGRTLEDSVKELLRPMLREWLDDNMERIVQDEVASAKPKDSEG